MDLVRDANFVRALLTKEITVSIEEDPPLHEGMRSGKKFDYLIGDILVRLSSRGAMIVIMGEREVVRKLITMGEISSSETPQSESETNNGKISWGRGSIRINNPLLGMIFIMTEDTGSPWSAGPFQSFGVIECHNHIKGMVQGYNPYRNEYYLSHQNHHYEFFIDGLHHQIVSKVTWNDGQGIATITLNDKFTLIIKIVGNINNTEYYLIRDGDHYEWLPSHTLILAPRVGQISGNLSLLEEL